MSGAGEVVKSGAFEAQRWAGSRDRDGAYASWPCRGWGTARGCYLPRLRAGKAPVSSRSRPGFSPRPTWKKPGTGIGTPASMLALPLSACDLVGDTGSVASTSVCSGGRGNPAGRVTVGTVGQAGRDEPSVRGTSHP